MDQIKHVDVLCVGLASYDLVFSVPEPPGEDDKMPAGSFAQCGGGPAANAAVTASRLGYRSAFIGYLGNDLFGAMHLEELLADNVLTDCVVRGSQHTLLSAITVLPDGRRSVVYYREGPVPIRDMRIDLLGIRPKVILFDGHEPQISIDLVDTYRDADVKTILDAGSIHSGTERLVSEVDYLVCSEKFGRQFTGQQDEQQAAALLSHHAPVVVITLGGRGLVWKTPRGSGHMPAFPVKCVDSTGAGDSFHGAFAACIAGGYNLPDALEYASAVAALTCTRLGARPGIPYKNEVEIFLKSRDVRGLNPT